jgi:sodium/hydrogen exchanger 10/11
MTDQIKEGVKQSIISSITHQLSHHQPDVKVLLRAGSVNVDVTIHGSDVHAIAAEVAASETFRPAIASSVSAVPNLRSTGTISVTNLQVNVVELAVGEEEGVEEKESESHVALLFFFFCLATGAFMMYFLGRVAPWFPYTVALLIIGIIVGVGMGKYYHYVGGMETEGHWAIHKTIFMWESMPPHLLLYAFLPGLIFADCLGVGWHLFKKSVIQCMILAIPGVIFATFVVAGFAMCLPYQWDFAFAMTFGSVLAATDPVAVVAIMKSLNAPDSITMLVSGESLLNDGSAIVVFNICNAMAVGTRELLSEVGVQEGGRVDAGIVISYFCRMALGGPALGVFFAIIACVGIHASSKRMSHDNATIQIFITFTTAYMSFFVAEYWLTVSGVLACVIAGVLTGAFGSPRFSNPEVMKTFWHAVENIGNTLIFLLSGLIIGYSISEQVGYHNIGPQDFGLLIALYGVVNAARFLMVFFLYPALAFTGCGLSIKSAVLLSFGGIHGAVGLALALVMNHEFEGRTGARVMFHIGGVTVLSLLVNGILSAPLLKKLGLAEVDPARVAIKDDVVRRIRDHSMGVLEKLCKESGNPSDKAEAMKLCDILKEVGSNSPADAVPRAGDNEAQVSLVNQAVKDMAISVARELFLHALRHQYEQQAKNGILPGGSAGFFVLRGAIDSALEDVGEGLTDVSHVLNRMGRKWWYVVLFQYAVSEWERSCTLQAVIVAHKAARAMLNEAVGSIRVFAEAKEVVIQESNSQVGMAQKALDEMDTRLVEAIAPRQIACKVLASSEEYIVKMVECGMLGEADAHHLLEEIEHDILAARSKPDAARLPVAGNEVVRSAAADRVDRAEVTRAFEQAKSVRA